MKLYLPENYKSKLDLKQTEKAIKFVKDFFQENLSAELRLRRVTAPLFVLSGTGINDDLNGVERPVAFPIKGMSESRAEIVQSLAKWKRLQLADFGMRPGEGLYTDMNAIRPDEDLDNLHSIYVDQWDWEKCIEKEDRTIETLKETVKRIFKALQATEQIIIGAFPVLTPCLPDEIYFITTQELEDKYPDLTPRDRENII